MTSPGRRAYRSPTRQRHAEETRRRIVEATRQLMLERGYGGATLEAIAAAAGVAPQTVTAAFGNKRGIVAEMFSRAAFGPGYEEVLDQIRSTPDPAEHLRLAARITRRIHEATSAELGLLRGTGAVAPELAELERQASDRRRERQSPLIAHLVRLDALKPGIDAATARDVLWALTGPDLYRMFVSERGWTATRYEAWLADQLAVSLLKPDPGGGSP